ncbi:MAG: 30S ribosomal protein S17 [uncultured bacterium (gcode 4)]|uniref:30S ribosomal protein S17 n=1 Tax=uncultured bacterium (gcode 4) TaxID=1234023 RepID=K1ZJC0_9BACT|nr:MAG: 30S ribosomal protein S17 [uncultured bacterium (gcode 4)]
MDRKDIDEWRKAFNNDQNTKLSFDAITKFIENNRFGSTKENILIKLCIINQLYSTNIHYPVNLANHIFKYGTELDSLIKAWDVKAIDIFRDCEITTSWWKGKTMNFYSFATKYCSFHNPEKYPKFDSLIENHLKLKNNKTNLRDYKIYKQVLEDYKKSIWCDDLSFDEFDKWLWYILRKEKKDKDTLDKAKS